MKHLIFLLVVLVIAYNWIADKGGELSGSYGSSHGEVIMYSLTTCGFCKVKARELRQEGIIFTERFIDTHSVYRDELNAKLSGAGFRPKAYGTPILDVRGVVLPNNPSMTLIKKYLTEGRG